MIDLDISTQPSAYYMNCWVPGCPLEARVCVGIDSTPLCEGHGVDRLIAAVHRAEKRAQERGFKGLIVPVCFVCGLSTRDGICDDCAAAAGARA